MPAQMYNDPRGGTPASICPQQLTHYYQKLEVHVVH